MDYEEADERVKEVNEQMKAENSKLGNMLNKAYEYKTVCGGWKESARKVSGEYRAGG